MLKTTRTTKNRHVQTVATTTNVYGSDPVFCSSLLSEVNSFVLTAEDEGDAPRKQKNPHYTVTVFNYFLYRGLGHFTFTIMQHLWGTFGQFIELQLTKSNSCFPRQHNFSVSWQQHWH